MNRVTAKLIITARISPLTIGATTPIAENTVIVITMHLFSLIIPIKPIIVKTNVIANKMMATMNTFSILRKIFNSNK